MGDCELWRRPWPLSLCRVSLVGREERWGFLAVKMGTSRRLAVRRAGLLSRRFGAGLVVWPHLRVPHWAVRFSPPALWRRRRLPHTPWPIAANPSLPAGPSRLSPYPFPHDELLVRTRGLGSVHSSPPAVNVHCSSLQTSLWCDGVVFYSEATSPDIQISSRARKVTQNSPRSKNFPVPHFKFFFFFWKNLENSPPPPLPSTG